jgi:hypothetical protein
VSADNDITVLRSKSVPVHYPRGQLSNPSKLLAWIRNAVCLLPSHNAAPEQIRARLLTMEMYKWEIMLVRPRGPVIGTVEAADRETAIKIAIEEFKITDPNIKYRLTAQRIG